ncbi:MAG: HisA/HisF-related TIM barrel protein [Bacillota bacterium]
MTESEDKIYLFQSPPRQRNPALLTEISKTFGVQSVIASIDVRQDLLRRYRCYYTDGTELAEGTPVELAKRAEELGAGEILLNSIDRDGGMQGYDLKLIQSVAEAVGIPLIACGGAGGAQDMKSALRAGAHAAAAGSMYVFYGPRRAVLIHVPPEKELYEMGVFCDA